MRLLLRAAPLTVLLAARTAGAFWCSGASTLLACEQALIIGIGVDNGVHVLHDFHSKPHEVYSASPSMVNAITLTQTTSMVGFGSMMISAHRGLHSLGIVLTIGVASCVLMSLVTLPACLAWLSRHRRAAAHFDATSWDEPHSNHPAPAAATPIELPFEEDEPQDILPMPSIGRVA